MAKKRSGAKTSVKISSASLKAATMERKDKPAAKSKSDYRPIETITSTKEIEVAPGLLDQVVGQERGIEIVRKAAKQKRNVLLVGSPGTGKSMLAQAMTELMPIQELEDILIHVNRENEGSPKVKTVKAGEGRKIVNQERMSGRLAGSNTNLLMMGFMMVSVFIALYFLPKYFPTIIVAAMLIGLFLMGAALMFAMQISKGRLVEAESVKLIVDNAGKTKAPFVDATGARAGALLGDVKHDPFQSLPHKTELEAPQGTLSLAQVWHQMAEKYPGRIEKRENGYEALSLPAKEKLYVLGERDGKIVKSRIFSLNRRRYKGRVVEARTETSAPGAKSVTTTPEHAFILESADKPAKRIGKGERLQTLN